jgi:hypothetical protein
MFLNERGVPGNDTETATWFRRAAEQGNADAQNNLGVLYYNGAGVPRSYNEAIKWYRFAAEQDNEQAQYNLGLMYKNGEGVAQDDQEAVKWFLKAAEKEDINAQFTLGLIYEKGQGIKQDTSEAVKWYRKAIRQGDEDALNNLIEMGNRGNSVAQFTLGLIYEEGEGMPPDHEEAAKWYRKAAEQRHETALNNLTAMCHRGVAVAQFYLGAMFQDGLGVPQNHQEARKWCGKAAGQGHATAQARLNKMKTKKS